MEILKFLLLFLTVFGFGMYINQMLIMVLRMTIYKEEYNKTIGISVLVFLLIASLCLSAFLTAF